MHSLSQIWTGIQNPSAAAKEANDAAIDFNRRFWQLRYNSDHYPKGTNVFGEDWDNLIPLDACRYDTFDKKHSFAGRLESRRSKGACSSEFIRGNFQNKTLNNVVCVTANLWHERLYDEIGASVHELITVDWDSFENTTAHPADVTEAAKEANEKYPNKRLLVHYNQPHFPYYGRDGDPLMQLPSGVPAVVQEKGHSCDEIIDAYEQNLEFVLGYVDNLLDSLKGKTVISSDHGESLFERLSPIPVRRYGHPIGNYIHQLIRVPWFVVPYNQRREVIAEQGETYNNHTNKELDERLRAIGYRTPE